MSTAEASKHVSISENCTTINKGEDAETTAEDDEKKEKEKEKEPENKRRHRRTFAELDRKFYCTFPDCNRPYATEHSLQQHIRLKHANSPSNSPFAQRRNRAISMPARQASQNASEPYSMYGDGQIQQMQPTDRRVRAPTLSAQHSNTYSPQLSRSAMRPRNNTTSSPSLSHSPNMGRSSPYQAKTSLQGNLQQMNSPNMLSASLAEHHHLNVSSSGMQRNVSAPHLPNMDLMMLNVQQTSTPPTMRSNMYNELNNYHSQSSLQSGMGSQSNLSSHSNMTSQSNMAATYLGLQMQRPMVGGSLKHSMSYANSTPSESMMNVLMNNNNDFQGMSGTYENNNSLSFNSLADPSSNNQVNMLNATSNNPHRTSQTSYNSLGLLDATDINNAHSPQQPQQQQQQAPTLDTPNSLGGSSQGKDQRMEALGSSLSGLGLSNELTLQDAFNAQQFGNFNTGAEGNSPGQNMFMRTSHGGLSELKFGNVGHLGAGSTRPYTDSLSLGSGDFNGQVNSTVNVMGGNGTLAEVQQQMQAQQRRAQQVQSQNQQLELQQQKRQQQQNLLQQQLERQDIMGEDGGKGATSNTHVSMVGAGTDALAMASSYADMNANQSGGDVKSDSLLDFMKELKKTMN